MNHSSRAAIAVYAAVVIAFAIMFLVMPYYADDLWYMSGIRDYFLGHTTDYPWQGIADTIAAHVRTDNGRLANMVFMALLPLPHWLTAGIGSVAFALALYFYLRLCRAWGRLGRTVWAAFFITMGLPWIDSLVYVCYQFNYVLPMAFTMGAMLLLFSPRRVPVWAGALLGLLIGMWHEGFGVPMLAGCVAVGAMSVWPCKLQWNSNLLTPWCIAFVVGLAVGTAFVFAAPGVWMRLDATPSLPLYRRFFDCLRYHAVTELYIALLAVLCVRRRSIRSVCTPLVTFLLVAAVCVFVIHVRTNSGLRVGWFGEMCACIGVMLAGGSLFAATRRWLRIAATALSGVLLGAHLTVATVMGIRVADETRYALRAYTASADGQFFMDFTDEFSAPTLAFGKPIFNNLVCLWNAHQISATYSPDKPFCPVPTALADVTADSGVPFPGHSALRLLGDHFWFIPAEALPAEMLRWNGANPLPINVFGTVTFGTVTAQRYLLLVPFTSRADGRQYYYIYPESSSLRASILPVKALNPVP